MKRSHFLTTIAATLTISMPALAKEKPPVVLVHGAWETGAIWAQVETGLKKDGYQVAVVNLPGRPGNIVPANEVTLQSYQLAVETAVNAQRRPVVLVGHSFGGFVISAEGEAQPSKIKTLVYVAAYLPTDGQSLLGLATTDAGSKAGPALEIDKNKGIAGIRYDARAGLFANDAPAEVGEIVAKGIVDEPLGPLATPIHLSRERFGGIDKVYVHTQQDHVVSPGFQTQMVATTPVRLELSVNTGHTPFITDPKGLIAAIEQAAK